jgi:hypothetical protein
MPNTNSLGQSVSPLAVTIPDACRISGYSRSELYRRLAMGDLEAVKIGRSTRVLMVSIERSLAALPRAHFAAPKAA